MARSNASGRSGLAAVAGGIVLVAIGAWLITPAPDPWIGAAGTLLGGAWQLAMALLAAGAVGLHVRQARRAGLVGVAGLAITCLGLGMGFVGVGGMGLPGIQAAGDAAAWLWPCVALGAFAVLPIGMLLIGAAMVRAKVVPVGVALIFIAGALVLALAWLVPADPYVTSPLALSLLGACWIVAGAVLWRDSRRAISRTTPATA